MQNKAGLLLVNSYGITGGRPDFTGLMVFDATAASTDPLAGGTNFAILEQALAPTGTSGTDGDLTVVLATSPNEMWRTHRLYF